MTPNGKRSQYNKTRLMLACFRQLCMSLDKKERKVLLLYFNVICSLNLHFWNRAHYDNNKLLTLRRTRTKITKAMTNYEILVTVTFISKKKNKKTTNDVKPNQNKLMNL